MRVVMPEYVGRQQVNTSSEASLSVFEQQKSLLSLGISRRVVLFSSYSKTKEMIVLLKKQRI